MSVKMSNESLLQNRMKSVLLCALIVFGLLAGFAAPFWPRQTQRSPPAAGVS